MGGQTCPGLPSSSYSSFSYVLVLILALERPTTHVTQQASDMTPNDEFQDQVEYETKENKDIRDTTPSLDTKHPSTTLPSSNSDPNSKAHTQALTTEPSYLEGSALVIVMSGLLLSLFLPALDQLILGEQASFRPTSYRRKSNLNLDFFSSDCNSENSQSIQSVI